MKQSIMSFLLVLLIEGICAVGSYLKDRLMKHMYQRDEPDSEFCSDPA